MEQTIKKVTNKEFEKIVDELIEKHGIQGAYKHLEQYEIALQFEPNHTNQAINEFIQKHCIDATQKEEHTLFSGSVRTLSGDDSYQVPEGFEQVWEWNNGYREVYVSEENLATITVCEGDLSVVLYKSKESYQKGYQEAEEFYQKY